MPAWLVIPKNANGPIRIKETKLVEAPDHETAAAQFYRQCIVSTMPFIDYSVVPTGDGPKARLPAEGQPQ